MERLYQVIVARLTSSPSSSSLVLRSAFDKGGSPFLCFYHVYFLYLLLLPSLAPGADAPPDEPKTKPAQIKISGYGFLGNWQLKRILTALELGGKKPEFLDASFVEDAALILISRVKRDGYLRPKIFITLYLQNG